MLDPASEIYKASSSQPAWRIFTNSVIYVVPKTASSNVKETWSEAALGEYNDDL